MSLINLLVILIIDFNGVFVENLEKDILKAIEITKCPNTYNIYDEMNKYSRIYQDTTENIKIYMPFLSENYKQSLLPTSAGDHQIEAILNRINEILLAMTQID